ncbi:prepilin-type N-terminal cleavage/methylation domain-containing protein [bacterium]|nr:MAG: prepilin-type N-terminal cleavage/methylation domain-containing protein [bacterium]
MTRRGFTLVEVLMGLMLLAILMVLIQGTYTAVARNKKSSSELTISSHGSVSLLHRMADELSMTFQNDSRPDQTLFLLKTDFDKNSTVEFSTRTPRVAGMREGGDTTVRYELTEDKEEDGLYKIVRTEMADPFGDIDRDGLSLVMMERVKRLTIEGYDDDGWTGEWDYRGLPDPKLPLAVRLTLVWLEKNSVEKILTCSTPVWAP